MYVETNVKVCRLKMSEIKSGFIHSFFERSGKTADRAETCTRAAFPISFLTSHYFLKKIVYTLTNECRENIAYIQHLQRMYDILRQF